MNYKIYKKKKSPTQSGVKKEKYWLLEDLTYDAYNEDPLTGWKSTKNSKIKLKFNSKQEAIDYAKKHNLNFELIEEEKRKFKVKSYSDNFKFKRVRTEI